MKFIADLHIHSKYSRATSKGMVLEELDRWADDKGILVMGTGDFTHPGWIREIKAKLEPAEPGLFRLKKEHKLKTIKGTEAETRFVLSVEISGIYSKNERVYRVHNIVFAPSLETALKINEKLAQIGNISSDGRPILGLDSERLAEIVFGIDSRAVIVPAHAWTPWFSVFGSMSGFDSIEECFGKQAKNIFAIETGLSSDPAMNRRISKLDNLALISNSDSHSLQRIGREANIFDTELSYDGIMEAIRDGAPNVKLPTTNDQLPTPKENKFPTGQATKNQRPKFAATIEFFPEEGKYHYDGHRDCGIVLPPEETKKQNNLCPKCGKKLTIGVMNRVDKLADREIIFKKEGNFSSSGNFVPFYSLVALDEIIAAALGVGTGTKKVKEVYRDLISKFGSEIKILTEIKESELEGRADPRIIEGLKRTREGKIELLPGYDGEYGKIKIFSEEESKDFKKQPSLFG